MNAKRLHDDEPRTYVLVLEPGERAAVGTGIAVAVPDGHAGLVVPRSGLAARNGIESGDFVEAARALYAGCEVVPILGPLPETRWVEPRAGDTIAASV